MIGKTLQDILNEKGMNPNELAKLIGVSNQTLYSIIKRDNMKIDFEVLLKICSALDVNIERFYSDYIFSNNSIEEDGAVILSSHQRKVIQAYINQPEMQSAVDRLLGIKKQQNINNMQLVYRAARSEDNSAPTIEARDDEKMQRFKNAPKVTSEEDL